ncbi:MAG: S8 family serine peptidase [Coriobacteriales bacterium]|jgi:subtilisin family serine protease|nr:S8 family serine peptidase [Coriobacteriales bacterium]
MDLKNKIIYIVSAVTVVIAMTAMIIIYALLLQPLQAGGTTLSTKSLEEATEAPVVAQTDEGQTLYTRPADGEEYAPEQVVITYGANEDETALFTAIEAAINDASSGAQGGAQVQALTPNSTTQKSALVRLPQDVSIEKASAIMLAIPQVSTAEPNHIAYATQGYSVNDPYAATTYWPIADNGQGKQHAPADTSSFVSTNMHDNGSQWWLASVHAFDAWNTVRTDGQVEVAVLDTGVRATHSDLQNNIDKTNAKSFVSGQNDAINDQNGHGTHVAGIIAAEANNNNMFAGVSYNAKVLPIQVLDKDAKGYISDIAAGLDYVTGLKTSGVLGNLRVVSMSLGAGADTTLHNAVRNATDAGLLCVAAVGNDGDSRLVYPGAYDESVCVGATDSTNGRAWCWQENTITHTKTQFYFSNHNQCVDIAAPGAVILSTYNNSDRGLCWDSGTSMATPIVAGTAALMFAENPSLTVSQAKSVLYDTATDLGTTGRDDFFGHGLVNAAAAVATPGASIITSIVPGDASLTVAFNAPASNGASAINGYKIEYSADATTWTTASNTVASSPYMISGLANGIQYYVRISAGNLMGYGPSTTTESTYAPVAPSAKPGAPSIESVSCGNGSLVVSFGAPQTGEGIDTYKIEYSADATTWTTASNTVASSPYTIYGLANGTAY